MYCEKCGNEIKDDSSFCDKCGNPLKKLKNKNMIIALLLTFIFSGLGIIYAGNLKKGLIFVALRILFPLLSGFHKIFLLFAMIIFFWSFYETYREVKIANGVGNPNLINDVKALIEDINNWSPTKKILALLVLLLIIMFFVFISIYLSYPNSSVESSSHSYYTSGGGSGSHHYGGVDDSPSRIARDDPDWYYDHYEYGDFPNIDDYLESQGF